MSDRQTDTSRPSSTSYASSIVALVLGTVLAALRRGRQIWPRLLIASSFDFAVLLLDSVVGLVRYRVAPSRDQSCSR
jgi:NAD dependent epimerase/dehydratase family enzyme